VVPNSSCFAARLEAATWSDNGWVPVDAGRHMVDSGTFQTLELAWKESFDDACHEPSTDDGGTRVGREFLVRHSPAALAPARTSATQ